ncbi:MAG: ATP-binding protein [Sumerlaeia bacterium]
MQRQTPKPCTPEDFREIEDRELEPFFREIADRFLSRQSNQFLLTGNVSDLFDGLGISCSADEPDNAHRYVGLERYLAERLERRGRLVITYNIARGIDFGVETSDKARRNECYNALREFYSKADRLGAMMSQKDIDKRAAKFDRSVVESQVYSFLTLRFLEELCLLARQRREGPISGGLTIIVKHAEMLLPDAPLAQMSDIDRQKLTLLTEWFTDPEFLESNEQVILVAPTMASIHETLRRLPHMSMTGVPLPDEDCRRAFIEWYSGQFGQELKLQRSKKELAELTAGMTLLTIKNLFLQASYRDGEIDEADILEQLNRLLVSELGDKIEIVKPAHSMDDVVGATALKAELKRVKALLDTRDPKVAPVGILVPGPNGAGKTFVFEAWAAECDRLVIVLKNLRSMYFGQTDAIFEKLRSVLEALGNVIIFIDEADTVFTKPGGNTHETEARLFGNLIKMMGNPRNRGKIIWLLLTARPDNLAPDLKRSGRAGLHLPVFDPEGDDRRAYIDFILSRAQFDPSELTEAQRDAIEERTKELSPADFNEVVVELRSERVLTGTLTFEQVESVIGNILPSQIARQRRWQTLQAYMECSRKSLIPPSLADSTRESVERELQNMRINT